MDTKVYACYNKNNEIRSRSSSGGIYYLLAREVLENGGVVFAACYDGLHVKHEKIEKENDLPDSLGSKYIPSELGDTFANVRNELAKGRLVLFTGIPCQCGGLLSYINNGCGVDHSNLVIVDVICHGVPGKKAWKGYCESLNDTGFHLSTVNMRDKCSGWKNYSWRLTDSEGNSKMQLYVDNAYMKGFLSDLYLRPSCSSCRFKGVERKTDITLGDYWGVHKELSEMDDDKGTSLVFVHSETGQKWFDAVSESIVYRPASADQAVRHNHSIVTSSPASDKRTVFFQRLASGEDFCEIVDEMTRKPIAVQAIKKVKRIIKKMAGRS